METQTNNAEQEQEQNGLFIQSQELLSKEAWEILTGKK
jgi:hypothetical protein